MRLFGKGSKKNNPNLKRGLDSSGRPNYLRKSGQVSGVEVRERQSTALDELASVVKEVEEEKKRNREELELRQLRGVLNGIKELEITAEKTVTPTVKEKAESVFRMPAEVAIDPYSFEVHSNEYDGRETSREHLFTGSARLGASKIELGVVYSVEQRYALRGEAFYHKSTSFSYKGKAVDGPQELYDMIAKENDSL